MYLFDILLFSFAWLCQVDCELCLRCNTQEAVVYLYLISTFFWHGCVKWIVNCVYVIIPWRQWYICI